ncbi:Uncharacterised protein [Weissella viridescens]|uniref:Uncharacterized protein n=1 Tax=Weissella viridescens TaxID=1629 RepID=A0A380P970_WEIVI|nr:Uncharacterised protein [Weissella viridescens]
MTTKVLKKMNMNLANAYTKVLDIKENLMQIYYITKKRPTLNGRLSNEFGNSIIPWRA